MSVSICIRMHAIDEVTIEQVMASLVEHNVHLYRAKIVTGSPWLLRWIPDQPLLCDDKGCTVADTSVLDDAAELERKRVGSCGSLACAYAGYLVARGKDAGVDLQRTGKGTYHVVAFDSDRVIYDPQTIGGSQSHAAHA
jgi:hypothetical protein